MKDWSIRMIHEARYYKLAYTKRIPIMAMCLKPLKAWTNPSGGRPALSVKRVHERAENPVLSMIQGDPNPDLLIPCGQCASCALRKMKDWSIRMIHEARYYDVGCVLTLTLNPEYMDYLYEHEKVDPYSLYPEEITYFIKKLRVYLRQYYPGVGKIKYAACGEYGSKGKLKRPHYHVIIYGFTPDDIELHPRIVTGKVLSKIDA